MGVRLVAGKGEVVGTLVVDPDDEILAVTLKGVVIRTPASDVSEQGRAAAGVKVMSPDPGDQVVAVALVSEEIDGEAAEAPATSVTEATPVTPVTEATDPGVL